MSQDHLPIFGTLHDLVAGQGLDSPGSNIPLSQQSTDASTLADPLTDLAADLSCSTTAPSPVRSDSECSRIPNRARAKPQKAKCYVCNVRGCGHGKPVAFARKFDLQRHINSVHSKTTTFTCPSQECALEHGPRSFSRLDKLKVHMYSAHASDTIVRCPSERCADIPLTLIELHAHLSLDVSAFHGQTALVGGIPKWCCPMKPCGIGQNHRSLWQHIQAHYIKWDVVKLEVCESILFAKSILLVRRGCTHKQPHQWIITGCTCPVSSLTILCPVCRNFTFNDVAAFETHMKAMYLLIAQASNLMQDRSLQQQVLELWPDFRYYNLFYENPRLYRPRHQADSDDVIHNKSGHIVGSNLLGQHACNSVARLERQQDADKQLALSWVHEKQRTLEQKRKRHN